jgi:hypothetical protein
VSTLLLLLLQHQKKPHYSQSISFSTGYVCVLRRRNYFCCNVESETSSYQCRYMLMSFLCMSSFITSLSTILESTASAILCASSRHCSSEHTTRHPSQQCRHLWRHCCNTSYFTSSPPTTLDSTAATLLQTHGLSVEYGASLMGLFVSFIWFFMNVLSRKQKVINLFQWSNPIQCIHLTIVHQSTFRLFD